MNEEIIKGKLKVRLRSIRDNKKNTVRKFFYYSIFVFPSLGLQAAHANEFDKGKYETVEYLYEEAFREAHNVKDIERKDFAYASIAAQTLYFSNNPQIALSALEVITNDIFRSDVHSRLAKHFAENRKCSEALKHNEKAKSDMFLAEFTKRSPRHEVNTISKKIIEAYTLCDKIDSAIKLVDLYPDNGFSYRQDCYKSGVYSTIASALYKAGRKNEAETFFKRSSDVVASIKGEAYKICSLSLIAENEMDAGLLDQSYKTLQQIVFPNAKDRLLRKLANKFARKNKDVSFHAIVPSKRDKGWATLGYQSLNGTFDDEQYLITTIDKIKELDERWQFSVLEDFREELQNRSDIGLIYVARAYHELGKTDAAILILEGLIRKYIGIHDYEIHLLKGQLKNPPHRPSIWHFQKLLPVYLEVTGDAQRVLDVLSIIEKQRGNIFSKSNSRIYSLTNIWGALIGFSKKTNDKILNKRISDLLSDEYENPSISYGVFEYYMQIKDYDLAEHYISNIKNSEAIGRWSFYSYLASQKMGVRVWKPFERDELNSELCPYRVGMIPFRCF